MTISPHHPKTDTDDPERIRQALGDARRPVQPGEKEIHDGEGTSCARKQTCRVRAVKKTATTCSANGGIAVLSGRHHTVSQKKLYLRRTPLSP